MALLAHIAIIKGVQLPWLPYLTKKGECWKNCIPIFLYSNHEGLPTGLLPVLLVGILPIRVRRYAWYNYTPYFSLRHYLTEYAIPLPYHLSEKLDSTTLLVLLRLPTVITSAALYEYGVHLTVRWIAE